jgi:hypothetical protein
LIGETNLMKKNELSELLSNLLIVGSVSLAFMPFVLGDRLGLVVGGLMREGGMMIGQFQDYVSWLIS